MNLAGLQNGDDIAGDISFEPVGAVGQQQQARHLCTCVFARDGDQALQHVAQAHLIGQGLRRLEQRSQVEGGATLRMRAGIRLHRASVRL